MLDQSPHRNHRYRSRIAIDYRQRPLWGQAQVLFFADSKEGLGGPLRNCPESRKGVGVRISHKGQGTVRDSGCGAGRRHDTHDLQNEGRRDRGASAARVGRFSSRFV